MKIQTTAILIATLTFTVTHVALADDTIVITKTAGKAVPVAVSGFTVEVDSVLRFDLYISGMDIVNADDAEYLVSGVNKDHLDGRLAKSHAGPVIFYKTYNGGGTRAQAHAYAMDIVQAVLGLAGIFAGADRVLRGVGRETGEIAVADFDGGNMAKVTHDGCLVATPCWLPGGRSLLYASWVNGPPQILQQDLNNGSRKVFAGYPGSISAHRCRRMGGGWR